MYSSKKWLTNYLPETVIARNPQGNRLVDRITIIMQIIIIMMMIAANTMTKTKNFMKGGNIKVMNRLKKFEFKSCF